MKITKEIKQLIKQAFREDAPKGDITSRYFVENKEASAVLIAKQSGILCGIDLAAACFKYADKKISFTKLQPDGAEIEKGMELARIKGNHLKILLAERVALNFLQFLSGIATKTRTFVKKIEKTNTKILDTRKTLPGYRVLSKYAVVCGGGTNHRQSLSSMVLVKENHLHGLSLEQLKNKIKTLRRRNRKISIEFEAENKEQVANFLTLPINMLMLDNMSNTEMKECVALRNKINHKILLEASGNMSLETILPAAKTGVDFISVGALTHSVEAFDISLLVY